MDIVISLPEEKWELIASTLAGYYCESNDEFEKELPKIKETLFLLNEKLLGKEKAQFMNDSIEKLKESMK